MEDLMRAHELAEIESAQVRRRAVHAIDAVVLELTALTMGAEPAANYDKLERSIQGVHEALASMGFARAYRPFARLHSVLHDRRFRVAAPQNLLVRLLADIEQVQAMLVERAVAESVGEIALPTPAKVVVIDDEREILDILKEWFARSGIATRLYSDVRKALEEIPEIQPDLILSDCVMPGMNGVDLIQSVKRICPTLPIVLMSGQFSATLIDQVRSLGIRELIEKPFTGPELVERCERLLLKRNAA